ncbi:MAG: helix-turn-helix domain-containing protein [Blastocatellales bacterium]|nr:helix-turn-helix domain-containing protein [Blastocatellales bacterium]
MSNRDLTIAEAAERLNAADVTVRLWCRQGRFPNARTEETPFGGYWLIPESDLRKFKPPKMGRPPKPKPEEAAAPKKTAGRKGTKTNAR